MRALVRAEALRLVTLRSTWLAVAATALLAGLVAGHVLRNAVDWGRADAGVDYLFLPAALVPAGVALIAGLVAVPGEFQHRTAEAALLTCSHRGRWVLAKLVVHAGFGAALAALAHVLVYGAAAVVLPAYGLDALGGWVRGPAVMGGLATAPVLAAFGVALGAWTRHQVTAVLAAASLPVVPHWLFGWFPWSRAWAPFPDEATLALAGAGPPGRLQLIGAAVLSCYTLALLAGALRWSLPRDVT